MVLANVLADLSRHFGPRVALQSNGRMAQQVGSSYTLSHPRRVF